MGNKILVLAYLAICFSIVSCEREESDGLILDAVDVKKQAPLTLTYQESLTGANLNIPFHYFLREGNRAWAPSFTKRQDGLKAYDLLSSFNTGRVGGVYLFKSEDKGITVDDVFDSGSAVSLTFEDNDNYIIEYQDKNIIIYRGRDVGGMLHLLYHDFVRESDLHIVYTSTKSAAKLIAKEGEVVMLENYEDDDVIYPIVDDLRLIKGVISNKRSSVTSVPRWAQYKKELPFYGLKLHEDTVPKIKRVVTGLDIGGSNQLNYSKKLPPFIFVAVSNSDTTLRVFNKDLTDKELWHYLKRIDDEAISYYEKRSYEIDIVYKDDTNLLVKFKYTYNPSKHVYFSVSKLLLDDKSIIISAQSETEPMARFYLSYFNHVQDITNNPASP